MVKYGEVLTFKEREKAMQYLDKKVVASNELRCIYEHPEKCFKEF